MNNQKKFQKKKNREKEVRKKVLQRREELRATAAKQRQEELRAEEEFQLITGKPEPFLKSPEAIAAREAIKKANVEKRIKKNLALLEALEKEFDQEQAARQQLNAKLEEQGHTTVKDKLSALIEQAKEVKNEEEPAKWFHGCGEDRGSTQNC
jgi:hypothetical protein